MGIVVATTVVVMTDPGRWVAGWRGRGVARLAATSSLVGEAVEVG